MKYFVTTSRIYFLSALTFLAIVVGSSNGHAQCKMSLDIPAQFFSSYETNTVSRFGDTQSRLSPPSVVERCQNAGGRYLMVSLALLNPRLSSEMGNISFDGKLSVDQCRIENTLLSKPILFEERRASFEEKFHFLRSCTYLRIWDIDKSPIDFPQDQANCKLSVDKDGIVTAEGDMCFIAIRPMNRFAIGAVMKPECANREFLRSKGISPGDVDAVLSVYTAGDASGNSPDLDTLGTTRMRFVVTPDSHMLPLSEDIANDHPRFPTDWAPEVHMGNIRMQQTGVTRTNIDLNLLVDSRTPRRCFEGLCAGPGDFSVPVVGDVELNEVSKTGKKTFIDGWYYGAIAPAQWQGLLKSPPHFIDSEMIKVGGTYEMSVTFIDPYDDYMLFVKGMSQMLLDLKQLQGTAGLDALKPFDSMLNFTSLPSFSGLPSITAGDIPASMERFLAVLKRLGGDRDWPVYYEKFCDSSLSNCVRPNMSRWFLKLTTQFQIAKKNSNSEFEIKNVRLIRESTHDQRLDYRKSVPNLPKVICNAN